MTKVTSLKERLSLSENELKIIAIIAMTIDHLAWMKIEEYSQAQTFEQIILHYIGRIDSTNNVFLCNRRLSLY